MFLNKKVFTGAAVVLVLALGLIIATPKALASSSNFRFHTWIRNDHEKRMISNFDRDKPMVIINTDRDSLERDGMRNFFTLRNVRDQMFARRIIFVDRDNPKNEISIRNSLTGPNSINIIRITLDHDFFVRLSRQIDLVRNNININVNTGNNTVMFNTVVGNITTGDVSISVR